MRDLAMCGRLPDVMRGEEAKIVGALDTLGGSGLVYLPGTQAKWVRLQDRRIAGFTTHMTGEVFGALRDDTILGYLMRDAPLDSGVRLRRNALGRPSGLLHHLFSVRALGFEHAGGSYRGRVGADDRPVAKPHFLVEQQRALVY
jgi:2-keto-3-deoxy-galactonokinase